MRVGNEATARQLVKWSDFEDLLEVKSETTGIVGGVVSSIEQLSVR